MRTERSEKNARQKKYTAYDRFHGKSRHRNMNQFLTWRKCKSCIASMTVSALVDICKSRISRLSHSYAELANTDVEKK